MLYDAMRGPEPRAWLSLPEEERVAAIERAHHPLPRGHAPVSNPRLHAAIHAVVETQLAQDTPQEVRKTLGRLVREGLTRHEAVHAIGAVAAEAMARFMRDKTPFDAQAYAQELAALRAEGHRGVADND